MLMDTADFDKFCYQESSCCCNYLELVVRYGRIGGCGGKLDVAGSLPTPQGV
jgi:hypothetical protein